MPQPQQRQILNPLSKARDRTCVLMDAGQVNCWRELPEYPFWNLNVSINSSLLRWDPVVNAKNWLLLPEPTAAGQCPIVNGLIIHTCWPWRVTSGTCQNYRFLVPDPSLSESETLGEEGFLDEKTKALSGEIIGFKSTHMSAEPGTYPVQSLFFVL